MESAQHMVQTYFHNAERVTVQLNSVVFTGDFMHDELHLISSHGLTLFPTLPICPLEQRIKDHGM